MSEYCGKCGVYYVGENNCRCPKPEAPTDVGKTYDWSDVPPPAEASHMDELNNFPRIEKLGLEVHSHDAFRENESKLVWADELEELLSHLTEAAGEFDEKAAIQRSQAVFPASELHPMFSTIGTRWTYITGANWQHAQDAAKIGLAEKKLFERHEEMGRLEARLTESEQVRKEDYAHYNTIVTKLTAAEARVKELEAESHHYQESYKTAQKLYLKAREALK